MHVSKLSKEHQEILAKFHEAEDALKAAGFCIHTAVALYVDNTSAHFSTRVSTPFKDGHFMIDHSFADAMRNLGVEWSNSVHDSQLVWRKGRTKQKVV